MAWATASFENVLDDLSSRFIINVPDEELASVERICFQIEQAHWYYEDFVREQNPSLPSFNLKNFSAKFFQHCPLLHEWSNEHETAFAHFMEYKIRVPVCGAIILNEAMDKCILVKGWTARSGWGFPKGKINKDEPDTTCAAREVWEETGFDASDKIKEEDYVEQTIKDQRIRLFIIKGVSESTMFEPQTRKEISKIEWHYIADLPAFKPKEKGTQSGRESGTERVSGVKNPGRYYMVTPFIHKLKSWINAQKRNTKRNKGQPGHATHHHSHSSESQPRHQNHPQPQSQNHHQHQAAAQTISTTEARLDSEVLKSMLGIGKATPSQELSSSTTTTTNDNMNSSESLKALLGIQSSTTNNMNMRDGMATGSPTIHPTAAQYSASRPVSTPLSSSSSSALPYQGSEALKAMLGISTQASPLLHFHAIANGASPVMTNAGLIPNGHGHGPQQRPDFSPQIHFSSTGNSPVHARNGSVDLLALLKGGGGGGGGGSGSGDAAIANGPGFTIDSSIGIQGNGGGNNDHSRNNQNIYQSVSTSTRNGTPATRGMQNFAFDVDGLL